MTVDLEDWFVVENLKENIDYTEWKSLPSRVEKNTARLLELFDYYGVRATFFVLGWVADRFPKLIYMIASYGHEIGCHSYLHNRVDKMRRDEFEKDTRRAVKAIADASGVYPAGYRAPSWSINSNIDWAFEVLADLNFMYDSSLYPIKHDIYGDPEAPREIFNMELKNGKTLYEIPASTINLFGKNFPVGGGGYLRHSPLWFTSKMIRRLNRVNRPAVLYIHPWELDDEPPMLDGLSAFQKFRQYGSIINTPRKMELLLQKFDFCPAKDYISRLKRRPIGFERQ